MHIRCIQPCRAPSVMPFLRVTCSRLRLVDSTVRRGARPEFRRAGAGSFTSLVGYPKGERVAVGAVAEREGASLDRRGREAEREPVRAAVRGRTGAMLVPVPRPTGRNRKGGRVCRGPNRQHPRGANRHGPGDRNDNAKEDQSKKRDPKKKAGASFSGSGEGNAGRCSEWERRSVADARQWLAARTQARSTNYLPDTPWALAACLTGISGIPSIFWRSSGVSSTNHISEYVAVRGPPGRFRHEQADSFVGRAADRRQRARPLPRLGGPPLCLQVIVPNQEEMS